jgi:ABC-type sugar transport system ATPase subunit
VGLSGLIGSGRSSLVRTVFGAPPAGAGRLTGRIVVDGSEVSIRTPHQAVRLGIGLVPEDRKTEGLLLGQPIDENIALPQLEAVADHGIVRRLRRRRLGEAQVGALGIETASVRARGDTLSGGNQQKVVLAKWLALGCRILVLDEPTRGVDIGAKVEIYRLLRDAADAGAGVLVVSSSLPEILGLCDRILVMAKGRVVAHHDWSEATEEGLLQASFGLAAEERAADVG